MFQVNNTDTILRNRFDSLYKIDNFSLFSRVLKRCSDAKTLQEPLSLITDIFVIIVIIIINTVFVVQVTNVFFTVNVSLDSPDKDQDIQGGMKRKRKKCSDQDKAGELNKSFQSLVSIPPVFLIFVSRNVFLE